MSRPVPSAAMVAVLLILGLAFSTTAAAVDAPRITVGDFWTYGTNTTVVDRMYLVGQATFTIRGEETITINGTGIDAFRIALQGAGVAAGDVEFLGSRFRVSGEWTLVGEEYLEKEGLKIVSSFFDLNVEGVVQPNSLAFHLRVQNHTTVEVVEDAWRFPVGPGSSGTLTAIYATSESILIQAGLLSDVATQDWTGRQTRTFAAGPEDRVTVPAGTYDTVRIRETWPDGRSTSSSYAAAIGNNAASTSFNQTGGQIAAAELLDFRYQSLETPRILGLTAFEWGIVAILVASAGVAAYAIWRWRIKRRPIEAGPARDIKP